jgi:hypothetical protein
MTILHRTIGTRSGINKKTSKKKDQGRYRHVRYGVTGRLRDNLKEQKQGMRKPENTKTFRVAVSKTFDTCAHPETRDVYKLAQKLFNNPGD